MAGEVVADAEGDATGEALAVGEAEADGEVDGLMVAVVAGIVVVGVDDEGDAQPERDANNNKTSTREKITNLGINLFFFI